MTLINVSLGKEIDKLIENFLKNEQEGETFIDKLDAFVNVALEIGLIVNGVKGGTIAAEKIDAQTLIAMKNWDPDNVAVALIAPVFRRLGKGHIRAAKKYLKKSIEQKEKVLSDAHTARQSDNAKAPRKPHVIDELIEKIVRRKPDVTANELIDQLENSVGNGIITSICEPGRTLEE